MRARMNRYYNIFFFNDTATTEIYTLSLHDALPILNTLNYDGKTKRMGRTVGKTASFKKAVVKLTAESKEDRKSTRLNSSHANISYAVFCLKKKNTPFDDLHPTPTGKATFASINKNT